MFSDLLISIHCAWNRAYRAMSALSGNFIKRAGPDDPSAGLT